MKLYLMRVKIEQHVEFRTKELRRRRRKNVVMMNDDDVGWLCFFVGAGWWFGTGININTRYGTGTGSKQTVPGTSWSNTWYGRYLVLPVPVFNKLVGSSRITEYFYSILKTRGNKYRAPSCVLLLSPRKLHTLVIIRFVLDTFLARFIYSNM